MQALSTLLPFLLYPYGRVAASDLNNAGKQKDDDYGAAWTEMARLINANGGWVHSGLNSKATLHGGNRVRGVVASESFPGSTTLVQVPRKLFFTLDHFPELRNAPLEGLEECGAAQARGDLDTIRISAALALEARKGNASRFASFLRGLPTLSDFRAFYPRFMEEALLTDFSALPIAEITPRMQEHDLSIRRCFERWQKVTDSVVSEVGWEEMSTALARFRTRGYNVGDNQLAMMVPGTDLLNTEKASRLNTVWTVTNDTFSLVTTSSAVPAGSELYELYCDTCDNSLMMLVWGVYLEDNPIALGSKLHAPPPDCAARVDGAFATVKSLQEAAESVLDLDSLPAAQSAGWTAPRCRASALSSDTQGPLRCSLARLTWEYCQKEWGQVRNDQVQTPVALLSKSSETFNAQEVATLVGRSFIQAVQPALVQGERFSLPVRHGGSNARKRTQQGFLESMLMHF